MALSTIVKRMSIAARLYRPARWLSRRIRQGQLGAFRAETDLYRTLLTPGALCFDVGANIGEKSEAMLAAGCHVVAFEPNPFVVPELVARCGKGSDFRLVRAALGSVPGFATLNASEPHGQSSLDTEWGGNVIAQLDVPVVTLDAAIAHFGVPAYCKIDVEGWELEVLRGLTQPIPLLSFEFHLNDRDTRKTLACLDSLAAQAAGHANVIPAGASSFLFDDWRPLEEFRDWFPGNLSDVLPGWHQGEVFVCHT